MTRGIDDDQWLATTRDGAEEVPHLGSSKAGDGKVLWWIVEPHGGYGDDDR